MLTPSLGIGPVTAGPAPWRSALLRDQLREGRPLRDVVDACFDRVEEGPEHVWISRRSRAQAQAAARVLTERWVAEGRDPRRMPLYGLPFAVKDNIDVEGWDTTAACPAFGYRPAATATAVRRLLDAGALLVGKTNLDQFATGLVGVRTPYGTFESVFGQGLIPGGSSSGSAVAVGAGQVAFALGTDTAGSGRVPAQCNGIVGLKPTPGLVSTFGVVPACASLDVVSVLAADVEGAVAVLDVLEGYDPRDPWSRRGEPVPEVPAHRARVGVLPPDQQEFLGDEEGPPAYRRAVERAATEGGDLVPVDLRPFREVARLLYEGPWVAERVAGIRSFWETRRDAIHPVTRQVLESAGRWSATDAFAGMHRLQRLRRELEHVWDDVDVLLLPTTPRLYTIDEVEADPLGTNASLGHYTNFVNLLGLSALAVPTGVDGRGRPTGATLVGPAFADRRLAALALAWGVA